MSETYRTEITGELLEGIDVLEDYILYLGTDLLGTLLIDRTTHRNILWATTDYESLGAGYEEYSEILPELITGDRATVIQPRITKTQNAQCGRTRDKAEVFTPSWLCNKQNNLIDAQWFGRQDVFNTETETGWASTVGKIVFPASKKTWKKYVDAQRLEISCGEAPYLVSRYDTVTGAKIPLEQRIGLLDRKMRIVNENTVSDDEWLTWTIRAFQSVYGYEYQGDNLLIARENLLYTFIEYYRTRFENTPDILWLRKIARIISWNIWQMDGLKYVVPHTCRPIRRELNTLFGIEIEEEPCPGCTTEDIFAHTGTYCRIQDWRFKTSRTFISMMKGGKSCARL